MITIVVVTQGLTMRLEVDSRFSGNEPKESRYGSDENS
jgi:hypothetical protein